MGNIHHKKQVIVLEGGKELDLRKCCKLTGLYSSHQAAGLTAKQLKRKIWGREFAPIVKGLAQPDPMFAHECPICMLYYPFVNACSCCAQLLCTECYLTMVKFGDPTVISLCPFCRKEQYSVTFSSSSSYPSP